MRILEVLTYYRPHISGLTIYVERLSKAFARQGHEVIVLTSQYDDQLPLNEQMDGVHIQRVPVAFRVSKGVIMPTFGPTAWRMVKWADVIHLHLPQFDAPGVAFRARLFKKPVILTYHSDLRLPPGIGNRIVDQVVHGMNRLAGFLADAVVTYTYDFGSHSPFLSRYLDRKLHVIPPPVEVENASDVEVAAFRKKHNLEGKKVIGISARLAAEKGIEILLAALPDILAAYPETHVLHASPDAIGEVAYAAKLEPLFSKFEKNYHMLGPLDGAELTAFYRCLDCLVMCSLNNTETFGLVQIEGMLNGSPSVASDLPGVRQPVTMTGMGRVVPIGDPDRLGTAIIELLATERQGIFPAEVLQRVFSPDRTAREYTSLFNRIAGRDTPGGKTTDSGAYEELYKIRDQLRYKKLNSVNPTETEIESQS